MGVSGAATGVSDSGSEPRMKHIRSQVQAWAQAEGPCQRGEEGGPASQREERRGRGC